MPASAHEPPPASRLGLTLISASLVAAAGWLLFRTFVGLDFTDEMQYYGEIAALVRTGKFFQDDLFIQQLGYFWVFPFFKLHALLFPEQDYLILFGRLLLLGGYALTGLLFWRATARLGGFSVPARLAGLAALIAWIPFQLFAPSYNTLSYLLVVVLVAVWTTRERRRFLSGAVAIAALLVALTVTYPPAGVVLGGLLVVATVWRQGLRPAGALLALVALSHAVVGAGIVGLHGRDFAEDLLTSVRFSRSFGGAQAILMRGEMAGLLALVAASGWFIWRMRRGAPCKYPLGAGRGRFGPYALLTGFVLVGGALLTRPSSWTAGYAVIADYILLLMLLAASVGWKGEPAPADGQAHAARMGLVTRGVLVVGCAVLLGLSIRSLTGYYAISFYMLLLLGLAASARAQEGPPLAELAGIGTVLGVVFACSSGNGLHSFGVGTAGVIPFVVLYGARRLEGLRAGRVPAIIRHGALPVLVVLLLANGMQHPYGEKRGLTGFVPVRDVPAFAGLWTSPDKIEALARFRQLYAPGTLKGKRLLVTGPHPWFYFASRGQPATPMLFMHFDDRAEADEFVARRLFRGGEPDAILVTCALPPPIHAKIIEWIEKGCTTRMIKLPPEFKRFYEYQTGYALPSEIVLLQRAPKKP